MKHLPLSATLIFLGLNLLTAPAANAASDSCVQALNTPPAALEAAAHQAFREHRYAAAYGRYARLADAGQASSAEMALLMLLNGPALFGNDWSASEKQQGCWNTLAVARARLRLAPNGRLGGD